MLHWRRNVPELCTLYLRVFAYSCTLHLVLIALMYTVAQKAMTIIVSEKSLPIFFTPEPAKKPVASVSKAQPAKKVQRKAEQKKKVKQEPVKKVVQKQKTVEAVDKQVIPDKKSSEEKKVVEKKVETQKVLEKVTEQTQKTVENSQNSDAARMDALENQVRAQWRPPVGCAAVCSCTITACIDKKGIIDSVTMVTPSNMLIFDVAARAVLYKIQFPRWSWGRSVTITFKP